MEAVDPIAFEIWIGENFIESADTRRGSTDTALRSLIADAVMDPQVTILARAVAETGIDEIQARMTLALMQGFLRTQSASNGEGYV